MLRKLFQALRAHPDDPLPDPDAELALGALLVRVAKVDHDYQIEEISLIDRILARLFQHSPIEAAKIRATCEKLHAAAPETDTFAKLIRETTGLDERLAALDALWEVVLADGEEQEAELKVVESARKAMGLSIADSETARERALKLSEFWNRGNYRMALRGLLPISCPMFGDFLKRLTQPDPAPLAQTDARLALSALLVRIARSDNDYASVERLQIDRILETRYALTPTEAVELRADAEALEAVAPDTVRFTRAIKDAVPYEDRCSVIEALWQVVLADGNRSNEEDALLRLVAGLLGVSDVDSAVARHRAAKKGAANK